MLKFRKNNWVEGASPLTGFKILKFTGSLILGKQADVLLTYRNKKSVQIFGNQEEVVQEVFRRLEKKRQVDGKIKMIADFTDAWNKAEEYGYSEYKRISGDKNPFETFSPQLAELISDKFYKHASPAKLISQRLSEKGMDGKELAEIMQKLGQEVRQNQSTTYTHLSGKSEVSRNVAIEYSKILDIDPVDLMFPKKTTKVWGKVNTKKGIQTYRDFSVGEIYPYSTKELETVTTPRDIWKKNICAIKMDARGTMFDQQVAFYYHSNSRDESCINKLCVVGIKDYDPITETEDNFYFLGLYQNVGGVSNLINFDPYADEKNKIILKDFEPTFITPVVCILNPQNIVDETAKQISIPPEVLNEQAEVQNNLLKEKLKLAEMKIQKQEKDISKHSKAAKEIEAKSDALKKKIKSHLDRLDELQNRSRDKYYYGRKIEGKQIINTHKFYNDGTKKIA